MKKNITILVVILIFGFSIGFFVKSQLLLPFEAPQPIVLPPKPLPLPPDLLSNPVLGEIYANTEGTIVAKSEDSLVLEKDGRQITLFVEEGRGLTTFEEAKTFQRLKFEELKRGDYLNGGISIITQPSQSEGLSKPRKAGDMLAHFLYVSRQ